MRKRPASGKVGHSLVIGNTQQHIRHLYYITLSEKNNNKRKMLNSIFLLRADQCVTAAIIWSTNA